MLVGSGAEVDVVSEFFDEHAGDVPVAVDEAVEVGFEKAKDIEVEVADDFQLAFLRFSPSEVNSEMDLSSETDQQCYGEASLITSPSIYPP